MLVFYLLFLPLFNIFFKCNRFLVKPDKNVLIFEFHPKLAFLRILRILNLKPIIQNS